MTETTDIDIVVETVKTVGKDVYEDGLKPVVKPTGELGGLIPRTIKAALAPLEKWIMVREYNLEATRRLLEEKLQNTPAELIESPEPYIAVPALQYTSYCMDNDELRNMYANLLANSMTKVVKDGVHPGFVEIIKQLSPDEAKILKHMKTHPVEPTITLKYKHAAGGGVAIIRDFSDIGERVGCEQPQNIAAYFDNMVRLGLIVNVGNLSYLTDKTRYEPLKHHRWVSVYATDEQAQARGFDKYSFEEGFVRLSAYGENFCSVCLDVQKS